MYDQAKVCSYPDLVCECCGKKTTETFGLWECDGWLWPKGRLNKYLKTNTSGVMKADDFSLREVCEDCLEVLIISLSQAQEAAKILQSIAKNNS